MRRLLTPLLAALLLIVAVASARAAPDDDEAPRRSGRRAEEVERLEARVNLLRQQLQRLQGELENARSEGTRARLAAVQRSMTQTRRELADTLVRIRELQGRTTSPGDATVERERDRPRPADPEERTGEQRASGDANVRRLMRENTELRRRVEALEQRVERLTRAVASGDDARGRGARRRGTPRDNGTRGDMGARLDRIEALLRRLVEQRSSPPPGDGPRPRGRARRRGPAPDDASPPRPPRPPVPPGPPAPPRSRSEPREGDTHSRPASPRPLEGGRRRVRERDPGRPEGS
ncbi:MAG: hypothetical protein ACYTG6_05650 [Planctomycetota bacterium]